MSDRTNRTARVSVSFTPTEHAALTARAAHHKVPVATYLRNVALGANGDATPGSPAAAADAWWFSMSGRTRAGIRQWLGRGKKTLAGVFEDTPTLPLGLPE